MMKIKPINALDMADRCYGWEGYATPLVYVLANGMEDMNCESLLDILYESYFDMEFNDED